MLNSTLLSGDQVQPFYLPSIVTDEESFIRCNAVVTLDKFNQCFYQSDILMHGFSKVEKLIHKIRHRNQRRPGMRSNSFVKHLYFRCVSKEKILTLRQLACLEIICLYPLNPWRLVIRIDYLDKPDEHFRVREDSTIFFVMLSIALPNF